MENDLSVFHQFAVVLHSLAKPGVDAHPPCSLVQHVGTLVADN